MTHQWRLIQQWLRKTPQQQMYRGKQGGGLTDQLTQQWLEIGRQDNHMKEDYGEK